MARRKTPAQRTCESKQKWETKTEARRAMNQQRSFADFRGKDRYPLQIYKCRVCGLWHVGTPAEDRGEVKRRPRVKAVEVEES